jgi:hypothetical protein
MGCDIHFFVEVKTKNGWELYSSPNVTRSYALFAKLANVRNYNNIEPISEPKGFPEDASYLVKKEYEYWDSDAHSASYLKSNEIVELEEWLKNEKPYSTEDDGWAANDLEHGILHSYLCGNSFGGIKKYPDEKPEWIEDVRFVFWFDN